LTEEAPEVSHQQADKHGATTDDALKSSRRQTSTGTRHGDRSEDSPVSGTPDAVALRSELARFLGPAVFPATPHDLLAAARANHATEDVDRLLQRVPDRVYRTVEEVWEAIHGPMAL
jgi:hypothetical protein